MAMLDDCYKSQTGHKKVYTQTSAKGRWTKPAGRETCMYVRFYAKTGHLEIASDW